jgi:poly-gamma-glutamate capsule biosynthesis protein CapA/YwtB (metallophosphatase superfamily)
MLSILGDFCPIGELFEKQDDQFHPFLKAKKLFSKNLKVIANLECPITDCATGLPFKWANLRASEKTQPLFKGLDLAVLANNHISDFGDQGVSDTLRFLDENQISHVGYGTSIESAIRPAIMSLGENTVGVIALSCPTTNGENLATHTRGGVAPLGMELLGSAIERAKSTSDALLVYLHWGCEWVHDPVPDQMRLARFAVDCGADAVVGCHSHTIQSYEQYRGRWIFYGLGNFLFGQGFGNEVLPDGSIRQHSLRSEPCNRESLNPIFSIRADTGEGKLRLENVRFFQQTEENEIREIQQSQLSFDLRMHNLKLKQFAQSNWEFLKLRHEIPFKAQLRNGVLAYWYSDDPILSKRPTTMRRRILNSLKPLAKFLLPASAYQFAVNFRRTWRQRLQNRILKIKIRLKWLSDKRKLPLTDEHRELYDICHRIFWLELHDFPNLITPRDFNDRIQWLKLFDQTEAHIQCSDKILVRDYVREKIGDEHLVKLYQTCDNFDQIDFSKLPNSFVIKTNHDSGTAVLVRNKAHLDLISTKKKIEDSLNRTFGWELGEWAYSFVHPKILVEQFIAPENSNPPPDYKFYVVEGRVKFMHFISDRGANTKEQTVSPMGADLATSLYPSFQLSNSFQKPACWDEMIQIAESLGKGFKCVRVDMFQQKGRVYVGEMTFWPMFGCYKGEGQKKLGALLDFDRTTFKHPIYHKLPRRMDAGCR